MGSYKNLVKDDMLSQDTLDKVFLDSEKINNQRTAYQKKNDKIRNVCTFAFCATLFFGLGGTTVKSGIEANDRFSGLDTSLMNKTLFQTPVCLDTKDGEVLINIKDAFTDYQKKQIVDGITKLDDILDGINYTVTFEDKDVKKAINITTAKTGIDKNALAETSVHINSYTAKITYPMTIVVNDENLHLFPRALTRVIQHELLHTLGFTDLYDSNHYGYMMYYSNTQTDKYSPEELAILNQVYSKDYTGLKESRPTTVIRPKTLKLIEKDETRFIEQEDSQFTF